MNSFESYFRLISDARQESKVLHNLIDILFIIVAASIARCDDWDTVIVFAHSHEAWLRQYIQLPNGIS